MNRCCARGVVVRSAVCGVVMSVCATHALADWPAELVRSAEVIATSCNTNYVGGLVFDLANLPVVAWQENPVCADNSIRPYWGRRTAGGAWSATRVFDNTTGGWPSLLRGNVALTISTDGTPFMAYYSGWPGSQDGGGPVVNIIRVDLLAQPSGPGVNAGYIGSISSCMVADPIADIAIAPSAATPAPMLANRCACNGGVALGYSTIVGGGFSGRADVGPTTPIVSSSLGVTPAGAFHIVYSGSLCGVGDFLRHCATATPGAFHVIDSAFSGRADFAVSSAGVFHVAGIRTNGQVVYSTSTDSGVTWTPLAPVDAGAWNGQDPSISVSANGNVAVAYWNAARTQLRIAKLVGGSWTTEVAATISVAATGPAKLVYNRANRACLFYYNPGDRGFYFAPDPALLCDEVDFNGDTLFPDTQDITDFLIVFGGGECPTGPGLCGDIDFNNDGLFPDTQDIGSFLSVFSGGACV